MGWFARNYQRSFVKSLSSYPALKAHLEAVKAGMEKTTVPAR